MNHIWTCGYCDKGLGPSDKVYGLDRALVADLKDKPLRPELCESCYQSRAVSQFKKSDVCTCCGQRKKKQ